MKRLKYLLIFLLLLSQVLFVAYAQEKIRVACIGNSITYGYGLEGKEDDDEMRVRESYPFKLQGLLGADYIVVNYGVSGRTLLRDNIPPLPKPDDEEQAPYWNEKKYKEALAFKPHIVIIKLGTNDARPLNWPFEDGKNVFYDTFVEFINSFRIDNPNVKIYICYPIPYFREKHDAEREQARVIREEVIPIIKQVARKNDVHLIDLHSPFFGKADLTSDGVHPTADGATLIAQEVFKNIKMTYKP